MKKDKPQSLDDTVFTASHEMPFKEQSELGEVFGNLDNTSKEAETGFSNIDFNTRLTFEEINSCLVFDELKALGILPEDSNLTIQKKRLAVSLHGEGRREKVTIASAKHGADLDNRNSGGFLKRLFTPKDKE